MSLDNMNKLDYKICRKLNKENRRERITNNNKDTLLLKNNQREY